MISTAADARETSVASGFHPPITDYSAMSLSLDGVGKRYGESWAVRGLTLDVRGGEFISLLGPSGCGKTTTLRMIGGFEFADEGEIRIGNTVMGNTPSHRRPTNTVFQSYALFPHLTVTDNVAYGLRQRRVPKAELREQVAHALDLVRMRPFADRKPAQLSGGQQQRVALARALVNQPSVLLLDEPMSALDRKLREEMQLELKLLQQELGITFIFVTHDQEEALTMSDRIAVMNDGRIEQFADAAEVYDEPTSLFVATFVGQQNVFTGVVDGCGSGSVSLATGNGPITSTRVTSARSLSTGQSVSCTVRPESVAVTTGLAGTTNALTGTLMGISRIGHRIQLAVAAPDGSRVLAIAPASASAPALGSIVTCSWAAEAVHIFNEENLTNSLTV